MSETVLSEAEAETEAVSFLDVLRLIDEEYDLARNRDALRRQGLAALAFTTEEDRELLVYLVDVFTKHRPRSAARGLHRIAERDTPRGRQLAALLPPVQPGFADDDPRRFSNPHLFGAPLRLSDPHSEPDTLAETDPVESSTAPETPPAAPWNPHAMLPRITGPEQRGRLNRVLARIIDHLSERPFDQACAEIAKLRMLCHPDDLVHFDACVPTEDPQLYQPTDPDLTNRDTIARGIDANMWQTPAVRDRYRPEQRQPKPRPTARTAAPRRGEYIEQQTRLAEHRQKGAARRRANARLAKVAGYFDAEAFQDYQAAAAEKAGLDYLEDRERIYLVEAELEARKRARSGEETPRKVRRARVVDAEQARRWWDGVYVDFVSGQFDAATVLDGERVVSDDYSHRVAEKRTKIRIIADEREPFQQNGNDLDYDRAAEAPLNGWPCVSCFIERPASMIRAAEHHIDGDWRSDDGLCPVCRADGHPGMPALPEGTGPAEVVMARSAYFMHRYPGSSDYILDRVARAHRGHPAVPFIRAYIDPEFGKTPLEVVDLDAAPKPRRAPKHGPVIGEGQRRSRCRTCHEDKAVDIHNGRCTACCVHLGIVTVPPARQSVAV
ncbi:hypothetical protein OG225_42520 (plasmid) [Nocardia sp. NBC_01377]|uniref:hypothetical protein n=1 Tax=Nocardia sp. NBC_01377 TaxID=2903595 RepID=UPI002F90E3CC